MTIYYSGQQDKFWIRDGDSEGVLWFDTEAAAREYQCTGQLKMVLQREADSQRRHDEKVERLEAEIERLRGELQAIIEYSQKHVDHTDAYVMSKRNTQAAQNALGGK